MVNVGEKSTCGFSPNLRKYSATEKFVCSTALTTSGKNCLTPIAQKEILHFHICKKWGKKDNYSTPWFLYLSGEGLLRQPSWTSLHSTLRKADETQSVWTGHTENIRLLGNDVGLQQSCAREHHGQHKVLGHFHSYGPPQGTDIIQLCNFTKILAWLCLWPPLRGHSWRPLGLCLVSKNCFRKRKHNSKWCCQTQQCLFLLVLSQWVKLRCNLHCE